MFIIVYSLFLLIGIVALMSVIGWLPNVDPRFKSYSTPLLIADIGGAALMGFSQAFLARGTTIRVSLEFPLKRQIDIQIEECSYEVISLEHNKKEVGTAFAHLGPGGWQCEFRTKEMAPDYAALTVKDHTGVIWKIPNFSVRSFTAKAQH